MSIHLSTYFIYLKAVKEETSYNPHILGQQEQADIDLLLILTLVKIYGILIQFNWNVERVNFRTTVKHTLNIYIYF